VYNFDTRQEVNRKEGVNCSAIIPSSYGVVKRRLPHFLATLGNLCFLNKLLPQWLLYSIKNQPLSLHFDDYQGMLPITPKTGVNYCIEHVVNNYILETTDDLPKFNFFTKPRFFSFFTQEVNFIQ